MAIQILQAMVILIVVLAGYFLVHVLLFHSPVEENLGQVKNVSPSRESSLGCTGCPIAIEIISAECFFSSQSGSSLFSSSLFGQESIEKLGVVENSQVLMPKAKIFFFCRININ